jgi:transcriptional regulator with XRE-family HTH domain
MVIGERLRLLREGKNLSQGDIEKRTGLLRCYISRLENGHTVPAIETLEKLAHALEVPLYRLFYEGDEQPKVLMFPKPDEGGSLWGNSGKEAAYLNKLRRYLARMNQQNRKLLMSTLQKMTGSRSRGLS